MYACVCECKVLKRPGVCIFLFPATYKTTTYFTCFLSILVSNKLLLHLTWILLTESSVDNAESCLFDEVLFVDEKCEMLCSGRQFEWWGFSVCLADSVSPWDGGCLKLKVNACQNGALCKKKIQRKIILFAQHLTRHLNLISQVVRPISHFSKRNVVSHKYFRGCYFVIELVLCREIIYSFQRCLFSLTQM